MHLILIIIHVAACLFLIAVILFQAGRGGGLADTFGGSQLQTLFGTKSVTILTRLTTICASLFIITSLSLTIVSAYRSESLVDKVKVPSEVAQEVKPVREPVPEPKPVPEETTSSDFTVEEPVVVSPEETHGE